MTCSVRHPDLPVSCALAGGNGPHRHVGHLDGDEPLEKRTVTWHDTASTSADPCGWEEDDEYARRLDLGLRPIAYFQDPDEHPDPVPCPAWCCLTDTDLVHEVRKVHPGLAHHTGHQFSTMLSDYNGDRCSDDGRYVMMPATLNAHLTRLSNVGQTRIKLWSLVEGEKHRTVCDLSLTLDDAADLVTVLQHLLAQADAAELLEQQAYDRNAFELGRDYQKGQQGVQAPGPGWDG